MGGQQMETQFEIEINNKSLDGSEVSGLIVNNPSLLSARQEVIEYV
jgi:hypothetical protein